MKAENICFDEFLKSSRDSNALIKSINFRWMQTNSDQIGVFVSNLHSKLETAASFNQ